MRIKNLCINILLMLVTVIITVSMFEEYLRISHQSVTFNGATELPWMGDHAAYFMIDPEIGFRPIIGTDGYTQYGTLPNKKYPVEKRSGITRLLFIGDSVTKRGKIVGELKQIYCVWCLNHW